MTTNKLEVCRVDTWPNEWKIRISHDKWECQIDRFHGHWLSHIMVMNGIGSYIPSHIILSLPL